MNLSHTHEGNTTIFIMKSDERCVGATTKVPPRRCKNRRVEGSEFCRIKHAARYADAVPAPVKPIEPRMTPRERYDKFETLYLNLPYDLNAEAKSRGAWWDNEARKWTIFKTRVRDFDFFERYVIEERQGPIAPGTPVTWVLKRVYYAKKLSEILRIAQRDVVTTRVGGQYNREEGVSAPHQGTFVDYLVRHYLATQHGLVREDMRATTVLRERGLYTDEGIMMDDDKARAYNSYVQNDDTFAILDDIYTTSTLHHEFFREEDGAPWNEVEYAPHGMMCDIRTFLDSHFRESVGLELNPVLGSLRNLSGDCDILTRDEIVEIKCAKSHQADGTHFIQLFLYAALLYLNRGGRRVRTLSVYNPLLGELSSIDVSDWDPRPVCDFINSSLRRH